MEVSGDYKDVKTMKKQILFMLMLILGTAMGFAQQEYTEVDTIAYDQTPADEVVVHAADVILDLDKATVTVNESVSNNLYESYGMHEHYASRQVHIYTVENGQRELLFENYCRAEIVKKGKKLALYLWPTDLTSAGGYESEDDMFEGAEAIITFIVGKKSLQCTLDETEAFSLTDELSSVKKQRKDALEKYKLVKSFAPWIEAMFKTIEQTYNFCIGLRSRDLSLDEMRAMSSKYMTGVQKSFDKMVELEPSGSDFEKSNKLSKIDGLTPKTQQFAGAIAADDATPYTIVVKCYTQMTPKYDDVAEGVVETDSIEKLVMVMLEISSPTQKEPLIFIDENIVEFTSKDVLTQPVYRLLDDGKIEGKMSVDSDDITGSYTEVLTFDKAAQTLSRLSEHAEGTEGDRREIEYNIRHLKPEALTKIE